MARKIDNTKVLSAAVARLQAAPEPDPIALRSTALAAMLRATGNGSNGVCSCCDTLAILEWAKPDPEAGLRLCGPHAARSYAERIVVCKAATQHDAA